MCGILGRFAWRGPAPDTNRYAGLTNLLTHRGPDGGAFWAEAGFFLGHRRLAIIDVAQGRQPMATPDGRFVVTFNGEIYNYLELRAELTTLGYRFANQSDTEVLLQGYAHWGRELPEHLEGMFAFAIVDRAAQTLFLARDRFGEKPLFLRTTAAGVTFASELKCLAAEPGFARAVDEVALAGFLSRNYVTGQRTLLKDVTRLTPGTSLFFNADGSSHTATYWSSRGAARNAQPVAASETLTRIGDTLDRAVRLSLRSDVPVGVLLSGGIDSSLIADSAVRAGFQGRAYCLSFREASFSELPKAQLVAEQLNLPLTEVVMDSTVLEDFLSLVQHADDPLADSSAVALWALARAVAPQHKVVLSGDGGDELFGGYLTYQASLLYQQTFARLPRFLRSAVARASHGLPTSEGKVSFSYKLRRFLRAVDLPPELAHASWNGTWLPAEVPHLLRVAHPHACVAAMLQEQESLAGAPSTLTGLQLADTNNYLPNDILCKVDRMSMAHGVEVRAPFLNQAVAELALALPEAQRTTVRATKIALRRLAEARFGPGISRAPKQGFSIPVHNWLRGAARPLVEDLLSENAIEATGVLQSAFVLKAKDDHVAGRRSLGFELWGLLVFVAWYQQFLSRAPAVAASELCRIELPALSDAAPAGRPAVSSGALP